MEVIIVGAVIVLVIAILFLIIATRVRRRREISAPLPSKPQAKQVPPPQALYTAPPPAKQPEPEPKPKAEVSRRTAEEESQGEATAPVPVDADMPDWLKEEPPASPAESTPDWPTEMERQASSEVPTVDWLKGEEKALPSTPPPAIDILRRMDYAPAQPSARKTVELPPNFSTFYPGIIKPNQSYALMTFVHLESVLDRVREIAAGYAGMMGDQQQGETTASKIVVGVGSLITFVPVVPGLRFDPPEQAATWQPPYQSATFLFTTPTSLSADLVGQVKVYQGPLIIGEIPVCMKVLAADVPAATGLDTHASFERYDPIFASYSHSDTPVMEYFRRLRAATGQKMLVDIYDLRAGEHWADRLLEMIDESAVFQLFWSKHSAQSKYCRQEWECALQYVESRPRFIQPVYWNTPMVLPPPELADLHFQRVPLPPMTQIQVAASQLRRVFRWT